MGNTQKGVQAQALFVESRVRDTCPATLDPQGKSWTRQMSVRSGTKSNFSDMKPQSSEADINRASTVPFK